MLATQPKPDLEFQTNKPALAPLPASEPIGVSAAGAQTAHLPHSIPREKAYALCALLLVGDWLAACVAVYAGLKIRDWQRMGWALSAANPFDFRSSLVIWSIAGGSLFSGIMATFKTYEVLNLYRMRRWSKNLLLSVLAWSAVVWAYIGLFQVENFAPRLGVVYCIVTLLGFVTLWRLASFMFLMQPSVKDAASSRVIVVGWNDKVAHLRKAMRRDLAQLSEIIGCVPMPGEHFGARPPAEVAVLGSYTDLARLVGECDASSIILSDVTCSAGDIQRLIMFCQREMLGFQLVPEYFPALNSGLQVQTLSGVPLLGVSQLPLDRTANRTVKRVVDIVGAFVGLVFSALIVPPFAVLAYLESPGPVFERQRRASRGGRQFDVFKLRTTFPAKRRPPDQSGPAEPERVLKIGAFIRWHDLDELPQFWNVLKGDLSLVGPCAERPELVEQFKDEIPNYNARHEARAGMTGWAQIHGLLGSGDQVRVVEADLYYLENWSLMLDFYCIVASFVRPRKAASEC